MKPKQFFYILSGITAIVLIGSAFMFVRSAFGFRTQNQKIGQLLADIEVNQDKGEQLIGLRNDYEKRVKQHLDRINRILPAEKKQEEIIAEINELAERTGARISGLNFPAGAEGGQAPSRAAGTSVLLLNFAAEGSYAEIQGIMQGLEQLTRLSDVVGVTLSKGSEGNVKADFKMEFYVKS